MKKYEVIIAWNGVEKGQILELAELSPYLRANVRELTANVTSGDSEELKKELKTVRSNLTKTENALKAKEDELKEVNEQLAILQGEVANLSEQLNSK